MLHVRPHIEIKGSICVGMTQYFLHTLYVCTATQKQGGATVAQIVGRKVRQIVRCHKPLDPAGDGVGVFGVIDALFSVDDGRFVDLFVDLPFESFAEGHKNRPKSKKKHRKPTFSMLLLWWTI